MVKINPEEENKLFRLFDKCWCPSVHTKLFVLERTEKSGGIINHLLELMVKNGKHSTKIPEFGHKQGEMKKTPCKNVH